MTQDDLFESYYTQYRTEADTPNSSDDEYTIFTRLANEGINRWANYDATFWKELYQTAQLEGDGDLVITATTSEYQAPDNMKKAGGYLRLYDSNNVTQSRIKIVEPQDAQFRGDSNRYCYFIGDPNNGFTLIVNGLTDADTGRNMDYVYYKKPTLFTLAGRTDVTEVPQPYFLVHRALANRFRGSRNPYYQSAKNDAEDVLKTMKMENDSGSWADPWQLADNSGTTWGL